MGLDRGEQLLARLDLQRPPQVDLAQPRHQFLGHGAREQEERPREARPVQFAQLPRPERERAGPPRRRPPPARVARPEIHLPALHDELPLQRREILGLRDAFLLLHPRVVERGKDRGNKECEEAAPLDFVD